MFRRRVVAIAQDFPAPSRCFRGRRHGSQARRCIDDERRACRGASRPALVRPRRRALLGSALRPALGRRDPQGKRTGRADRRDAGERTSGLLSPVRLRARGSLTRCRDTASRLAWPCARSADTQRLYRHSWQQRTRRGAGSCATPRRVFGSTPTSRIGAHIQVCEGGRNQRTPIRLHGERPSVLLCVAVTATVAKHLRRRHPDSPRHA